MNMNEHISEERVMMTVAQIKKELDALSTLLEHAHERRRELYALVIPREDNERRYARGQFLCRINNEIDDYTYRTAMLESMLAGMEG